MTSDGDLIPAATVVLLRDSVGGPEVLLLRRNSKIGFGGMWVFPGGRIDEREMVPGDSQGTARVAAAREAAEETGLEVEAETMLPWSFWIPPPSPAVRTRGPIRRFSTWFFVAPAPNGAVAVDGGEIHDHRWLSPGKAITLRDRGEIELMPPTWVTLWQLQRHGSVAGIMSHAATATPGEFLTRPIKTKPPTLAWAGDVAHDGGRDDGTGPRHRLIMGPGEWSYQQVADPTG